MYVFGEVLSGFRRREGLTQQELAGNLGVGRTTISAWERSLYLPRDREMVLDLAESLNLSRSDTDQLLLSAKYPIEYGLPQGDPATARFHEAQVEHMQVKHLELSGGPGYTPIPIRHFMTLETYLTQSGPRFPKTTHFEEELVYLPEKRASEIQQHLEEARRCLLVGRPASGKTVLAIALAKQLCEQEGYLAFYGDAIRAQEGDGRSWHQILCANDRPGCIYILDNCHLAPDEVNEFCFQWEGRPPEYAQVLLISRPQTRQSEVQSQDLVSYFDMWIDNIVGLHAEEVYESILRKYAAHYHRRDPIRYTALEDDEAALLREQHAHNLVASRSRLETWGDQGGRLSEVTLKAVYDVLDRKYLSLARGALKALCALWQFEIPAHNLFVREAVPATEIDRLEDHHLLEQEMMEGYGVVYRPVFHPEEAREIFQASVFRQQGYVDASSLELETGKVLALYLETEPPNYRQAYRGLHEEGHHDLQRRLLADRHLQTCAKNQFERGSIADTVLYLYSLSQCDHERAGQLLGDFARIEGADRIASKLVEQPLWVFQLLLYCLSQIDRQWSENTMAHIDTQVLIDKVQSEQNLRALLGLLRSIGNVAPDRSRALLSGIALNTLAEGASTCGFANLGKLIDHLGKEGYSKENLLHIVEKARIVERVESQGLQDLSWLIRAVSSIDWRTARNLLGSMPPKMLASKANTSNYRAIATTIERLRFHQLWAQARTFVHCLNTKQLAENAQEQSLNGLVRLLRLLRTFAPAKAATLVRSIPTRTLSDMASTCRRPEIKYLLGFLIDIDYGRLVQFVESIDLYRLLQNPRTGRCVIDKSLLGAVNSVSPAVTERLFRTITPVGIVEYCRSGPIARLSAFWAVASEDCRTEVRNQFPVRDLALVFDRSSLSQVGMFLLHRYAHFEEAYDLFKKEFLKRKLAKASLAEAGKFIHRISQVHEVGRSFAQAALKLLAMVETDNTIESSSLEDKLAVAPVRELGFFLWNLYRHVDASLLPGLCAVVDQQQRSEQLMEAHLDDLCRFLSLLVLNSDLPEIHTLGDPAVEQRLRDAWNSEIGLATELLGVVDLASLDCSVRSIQMPGLTSYQEQQLAKWFEECVRKRRANTLAITVHGMRFHSESEARDIAQKHLQVSQAVRLLQEERLNASSARAEMVLREATEWLEEVARTSDHEITGTLP